MEETNTELLRTQQELQQCQDLIKTMEDDRRYQVTVYNCC